MEMQYIIRQRRPRVGCIRGAVMANVSRHFRMPAAGGGTADKPLCYVTTRRVQLQRVFHPLSGFRHVAHLSQGEPQSRIVIGAAWIRPNRESEDPQCSSPALLHEVDVGQLSHGRR